MKKVTAGKDALSDFAPKFVEIKFCEEGGRRVNKYTVKENDYSVVS